MSMGLSAKTRTGASADMEAAFSELELDESDLQAIIEDHDCRPRHFGEMDRPDLFATGYNPVCGDRYRISLRLSGDRIHRVRFTGHGCVISRASSSMMTQTLAGSTLSGAESQINGVLNALEKGESLPEAVSLDLVALLGVRRNPGRIKCVTLGWAAALAAIHGDTSTTTE